MRGTPSSISNGRRTISQDARHNKHGERVEAIRHVNEAIEAARHHNHKAMEGHIDAAIRDVRQGKHAARR